MRSNVLVNLPFLLVPELEGCQSGTACCQLPSLCSTHQRECLEERQTEMNTKEDAGMANGEAVLLMYCESLAPPLFIPVRKSGSNSPFMLKRR